MDEQEITPGICQDGRRHWRTRWHCGVCGHRWLWSHDGVKPSTCPACSASFPHAQPADAIEFVDESGNILLRKPAGGPPERHNP